MTQAKSISYPIESPKLVEALAGEVRKVNESHYLIYRILLETGMPLNALLKTKVSALYRKPALEYKSRHRTTTYKVAISLRLQRDLEKFLKDRNRDEYAFIGEQSGRPIFPAAVQRSFGIASEKLNFSPPVSATILRKTFIYNTAVSDGNYVRAAHFIDAQGPKEVRDYLGVNLPEEISAAQAHKTLEKLTSRSALKKIRKEINAELDEIERLKSDHTGASAEQLKDACEKVESLLGHVTRFSS